MRASRERMETGAENASSCSRPNGEASPGFRQALAAWMRSLPTPETP